MDNGGSNLIRKRPDIFEVGCQDDGGKAFGFIGFRVHHKSYLLEIVKFRTLPFI